MASVSGQSEDRGAEVARGEIRQRALPIRMAAPVNSAVKVGADLCASSTGVVASGGRARGGAVPVWGQQQ